MKSNGCQQLFTLTSAVLFAGSCRSSGHHFPPDHNLIQSVQYIEYICDLRLCAPPCFYSDNILVLDIFFEALNYETIEQKKAYELAGLLGKKMAVKCFLWNR